MPIETVKQKDLSIEVLRAIAVIFVMVIHTAAKFTIMEYSTATLVYAFVDAFVLVAVPLFVFISGYVLGKRYTEVIPYLPYLKKRVLRIIPLYILATVFYLIFYAILFKDNSGLNLIRLGNALIHADASYHLWFFRLIVVLYLLFPFLNRLFRSKWALAFFMISMGAQIAWYFNGAVTTGWQVTFSHLFYFCLGIYIAKKGVFSWVKRIGGISLNILLLILTLALTYFWIKGTAIYGFYYSIPLSYGIQALLVSFFLYSFSLLVLFSYREFIFDHLGHALRKFLLSVGKYAFEIYLIHLAFLIMIGKFIYQDSNFTKWTFLPVSVFGTLLLSYFSVIYIYKLISLLRRGFSRVRIFANKQKPQPSPSL